MGESELILRRDEIQARLEESKLADKCVDVATIHGEDRDSKQGDYYTNLNYLCNVGEIVIDCDIGCNIQGDGRLFVKHCGKLVFDVSNSHPHYNRQDLPKTNVHHVPHVVLVYEPGDWEKKIADLSSSK